MSRRSRDRLVRRRGLTSSRCKSAPARAFRKSPKLGGRLAPAVDAARGACLRHVYRNEARKSRHEMPPDPSCQDLARRVLQTLDVVQKAVIELLVQRFPCGVEIGEVTNPPLRLRQLAGDGDCDPERVAV